MLRDVPAWVPHKPAWVYTMTKRIEITLAKNTSVVDVMADVDVVIVPEIDSLDLVDLIKIVLNDGKNKATFHPGKYNIRLMAVVTEERENESD